MKRLKNSKLKALAKNPRVQQAAIFAAGAAAGSYGGPVASEAATRLLMAFFGAL